VTYKRIACDPRSYAFIAIIAVAVAFGFRGITGGEGMALGLAGAGFSVTALWMIIKQLGRSAADSRRAKFAAIITVIAFFAKLPIYMLLGMIAHAIGGGAPTCFLLGVGLVYFALVGWALAQS
jgi:hypothetical protein